MSAAEPINEAAAIWLLRLDAAPSAAVVELFQEWLEADPRHRAAYVRLRFAWYFSETLRVFQPIDGSVDEDLITKLKFLR
jgi:ferric-dicitrate binding protein FerR (iron transport regulator)